MQRKNDNDSRHKIASIFDVPYPVRNLDTEVKTLIIERPDETVKNVYRIRVVVAAKTKTKTDIIAEAQPMKLTEIVYDYSVKEEDSLRHIDRPVSPPEAANNQ